MSNRTLIAEIGQNHCGNMKLAQNLILLAKNNGADLAKFQLYDHEKLYKDHLEITDCHLNFEQAEMLFDYGERIGIEVFFSVFDVEKVEWCEKIGVKRYKIACNMRERPVLHAVLRTGKPIYVSSNTSQRALEGWFEITWLYCVPSYPAPMAGIDMPRFIWDDNFNGFSDHTIGLDAAKIALARGAQIIEKHFAIDHQTGIDAAWSMTPEELRELRRWADVCEEVA